MTPATREWAEKAEKDFNAALRLFRARKLPDYDNACFHAQQCAEKYLKAYLQEVAVPFAKTHDLSQLLTLILPFEPMWSVLKTRLVTLTSSAVEIRYPGRVASKNQTRDAIATCREVRSLVRTFLKLPD